MTQVFKQADAPILRLPGRTAMDVVSGARGSRGVTLRLVEIPVAQPTTEARGQHEHLDFEECIFVLSGQGRTEASSGAYELRPGDTLLVSPKDKHATRNTGTEPLLLLCFFPVADIDKGSAEPGRNSVPTPQQ